MDLNEKNFRAGVVAFAASASILIVSITVATVRDGDETTDRIKACVGSGQAWFNDAQGRGTCAQQVNR